MSTNPTQDQEIDLGQVFNKIGNLFENIGTYIFKGILFVKKNLIILLTLLVFGVGIGIFLDSRSNTYNHEVIVSPNYGSVDYLYNKINLINSRIKQGDTLFLKSIGIEEPKKISSVSVKPIIDIYSFVNDKTNAVGNAQNSQNFELVKLLSEDGDINKVIKDSLTSKNYNHHRINISTKGFTTNKKTINPILEYLNNSAYYKSFRKTYIDNINSKIKADQIVVSQIDALLNQFSTDTNSQKNDKLVYYNENTQLNDIITTKNTLISEIGYLKTQLIILDKVILDKSRIINIKNTKGLSNKNKLVLPVLFIFGFLFLSLFISFYKKQAAKLSNK